MMAMNGGLARHLRKVVTEATDGMMPDTEASAVLSLAPPRRARTPSDQNMMDQPTEYTNSKEALSSKHPSTSDSCGCAQRTSIITSGMATAFAKLHPRVNSDRIENGTLAITARSRVMRYEMALRWGRDHC